VEETAVAGFAQKVRNSTDEVGGFFIPACEHAIALEVGSLLAITVTG